MKLARIVLVTTVVAYSSDGNTAEDQSPGDKSVSIEQAVSLREGQTRLYVERNATFPGQTEFRFTKEQRVKTVIKQPDGSRAYVIETKTIKAESQDEVTRKWRKDKVTAQKPDPVGS